MCHRAEQTNTNNRRYGRALLEREVASFTAQARAKPSHRAAAGLLRCESRPHSCRALLHTALTIH